MATRNFYDTRQGESIVLYDTFHNIDEWIGVYMTGIDKLMELSPSQATTLFALAGMAKKNSNNAILVPLIEDEFKRLLPNVSKKTYQNNISILIQKGFLYRDGKTLLLLNSDILRRGIQKQQEAYNNGTAKIAGVLSQVRDSDGISYLQKKGLKLKAGKDWYFRCDIKLFAFIDRLIPQEYKTFLWCLKMMKEGAEWVSLQELKNSWQELFPGKCTTTKAKRLLESLVEKGLLLYYGKSDGYTLNIHLIHNNSVYAIQSRYDLVMNLHKIGLSYRKESQERKQKKGSFVSIEEPTTCVNCFGDDDAIEVGSSPDDKIKKFELSYSDKIQTMESQERENLVVSDEPVGVSKDVEFVYCADNCLLLTTGSVSGETRYDIPPESFGIVVSESGKLLYSDSSGSFVEESSMAINSSSTKRN